jgi:hypothetical protein
MAQQDRSQMSPRAKVLNGFNRSSVLEHSGREGGRGEVKVLNQTVPVAAQSTGAGNAPLSAPASVG